MAHSYDNGLNKFAGIVGAVVGPHVHLNVDLSVASDLRSFRSSTIIKLHFLLSGCSVLRVLRVHSV